MDLTSVFDQTITPENDPLIITGLTSPVVMVHLLPETLKGSYPEVPVLAVEQILPNAGNPFIADHQLVEMKAEPVLVRLRANYPYSLRIDYPGWIKRGTLKVWEVTGFDFFSSGGSSTPIDLTGYVQATDPRLTDARSPLPHSQEIDTIDGLTSALASKLESSDLANYVLTTDPRLSPSVSGGLTSIESASFAISSGDETRFGGFYKEDAFNENYNTIWLSSIGGSALINNAFIGQNFGSARNFKGISIAQWGSGDDDNDRMIATAAIQTSSDGNNWFTQKTVNLSKAKAYEAFYKLNATAPQIRFLAVSACSFGWHVYRVRVWS